MTIMFYATKCYFGTDGELYFDKAFSTAYSQSSSPVTFFL
jgi:hypothetical protein